MDPGMQCYEQHGYWAACLVDCPSLEVDKWSCALLGPRTPGNPIVTTTVPAPVVVTTENPPWLPYVQSGATITATFTTTPVPCTMTRKGDCTYSRCCQDPGMQCYAKDQYWAACQLGCTLGVDPRDREGQQTPWSCAPLGLRTAGMPMVTTTILRFAPASPESGSGGDDMEQEMEDAGFTMCSITRKEDCRHTQCCADPGMQCFEKNEYWAACEVGCTPGIDPGDVGDRRTPWTCRQFGPRTPGVPPATSTTTPSPEEQRREADTAIFGALDEMLMPRASGEMLISSGEVLLGSSPSVMTRGLLRNFEGRPSAMPTHTQAQTSRIVILGAALGAIAVFSLGAVLVLVQRKLTRSRRPFEESCLCVASVDRSEQRSPMLRADGAAEDHA